MEKVKVIEFIQSMGDGGAETLVKDYALLMDRERFEVTVVVQHAVEDSANIQRLRECGVPILALSAQDDILKHIWRKIFWKKEESSVSSADVQNRAVLPGETYEQAGFLRRCRNQVRNLYFGLKFLRIVKQTGATVVHAHLDMLGCLQAVGWFLKDVRLFHTCHALPYLIYAGEEGQAARKLIRYNHLQLIALHDDMAQEMDSMFPEQKTVVIRNGVNVGRFRNPGISRAEKRQQLSIPEDMFVVGHVGRFTPEKNHAFLVDVFREIVNRKENAYLLMVGTADPQKTVERLEQYGLQDRYRILSHRKDVNEILKTFDVFVFPSIFEGFPVSVIEAQAAGIRCIISDQIPQKVICTEGCISMPLDDPQAWAEAALNSDLKREPIRSLSDYDMNREIRRLEKLYLGQLN